MLLYISLYWCVYQVIFTVTKATQMITGYKKAVYFDPVLTHKLLRRTEIKIRNSNLSYLCLYQYCQLHKYVPYFPYRIFYFQYLFMSCSDICQGQLSFQCICNNLDK